MKEVNHCRLNIIAVSFHSSQTEGLQWYLRKCATFEHTPFTPGIKDATGQFIVSFVLLDRAAVSHITLKAKNNKRLLFTMEKDSPDKIVNTLVVSRAKELSRYVVKN